MKMQPIQDFLNLLFPRICTTCDRPLARFEKNVCLHCEQELPYVTNQEEQQAKLAGRIPFAGMFSLLKFKPQGKVQKILHEIKYNGNTGLAFDLGQLIARKYEDQMNALGINYVIPIPLHQSKLKQRGYNQSALISYGISSIIDVPTTDDIVFRAKRSETQTKKSRLQRWDNVNGIFTVDEDADISGKHFLIVDDVFTTGATLEACGQELIRAGGTVSFATIASA